MTPNGSTTAPVTRTVFDLNLFDDVKLTKTITLPEKPVDLDAALAAAGNNKAKLLDLIHEGLCAEAKEMARNDISGFLIVPDEKGVEATETYTGKYADDEKGKLIDNAILALAKMKGYEKSLPAEKKRALKLDATNFLRKNPEMLESIQG